jgi:hypothetical protein
MYAASQENAVTHCPVSYVVVVLFDRKKSHQTRKANKARTANPPHTIAAPIIPAAAASAELSMFLEGRQTVPRAAEITPMHRTSAAHTYEG